MQSDEVYGWFPHDACFLRAPMSNEPESKMSPNSRSLRNVAVARDFRLRDFYFDVALIHQ